MLGFFKSSILVLSQNALAACQSSVSMEEQHTGVNCKATDINMWWGLVCLNSPSALQFVFFVLCQLWNGEEDFPAHLCLNRNMKINRGGLSCSSIKERHFCWEWPESSAEVPQVTPYWIYWDFRSTRLVLQFLEYRLLVLGWVTATSFVYINHWDKSILFHTLWPWILSKLMMSSNDGWCIPLFSFPHSMSCFIHLKLWLLLLGYPCKD